MNSGALPAFSTMALHSLDLIFGVVMLQFSTNATYWEFSRPLFSLLKIAVWLISRGCRVAVVGFLILSQEGKQQPCSQRLGMEGQ